MENKLCTSDRRLSILNYIIVRKQTTCSALAERYAVSLATITNDIAHLSRHVPIYTRPGGNGGIYILPEYKIRNHYLNDIEKECLIRIKEIVDITDRKIIEEIIVKFSRTAV